MQAADSSVGRLLTRAVLYRSCVARFSDRLFITDGLDDSQVHGPPRRPPGGRERDSQHNRRREQNDPRRKREWDRVPSDYRGRRSRQEIGVEGARDGRRHNPDDADHHGFEQDHLSQLAAQPADRADHSQFALALGGRDDQRVDDAQRGGEDRDQHLHVHHREKLIEQFQHPRAPLLLGVYKRALPLLERDALDARRQVDVDDVYRRVVPVSFVQVAFQIDRALLGTVIFDDAGDGTVESFGRRLQLDAVADPQAVAVGEIVRDQYAFAFRYFLPRGRGVGALNFEPRSREPSVELQRDEGHRIVGVS